MNKNLSLLFGSFYGLSSVLLGAFGAHELKNIFTANQLSIYDTAVRYQMYHALILCVVGVIAFKTSNKFLIYSSYLFIAGVIIFSGSLYLYVLTNFILFAIITPVGGVCLILGWAFLFYFAWKSTDPEVAT